MIIMKIIIMCQRNISLAGVLCHTQKEKSRLRRVIKCAEEMFSLHPVNLWCWRVLGFIILPEGALQVLLSITSWQKYPADLWKLFCFWDTKILFFELSWFLLKSETKICRASYPTMKSVKYRIEKTKSARLITKTVGMNIRAHLLFTEISRFALSKRAPYLFLK